MTLEEFFSFPWEGVLAFAGLLVLIGMNTPKIEPKIRRWWRTMTGAQEVADRVDYYQHANTAQHQEIMGEVRAHAIKPAHQGQAEWNEEHIERWHDEGP